MPQVWRRGGNFYQRCMKLTSLRVAVSRVHETAHFGEGAMGIGDVGGERLGENP